MFSKKLNLLYMAECVSLESTKGDFVHVNEVIQAFARRGHNVTFVIRGRKTPVFFKNHLLTFRLPDLRFPMSIFLYLATLLLIAIRASVRRPDVIYVRDNGLNIGVLIGRMLAIPVFLEINGDLPLEYSFKNGILTRILKMIIKNSYSLADVIIVPSIGQRSILTSLHIANNRLYTISNGVNHRLFRPLEKFLCRQELKLDRNTFYFCFVGNIITWQGLDHAIIALSRLTKEIKDIKLQLIIAGDGPEKKELEKLAHKVDVANNVTFLGFIQHDRIPIVVNACDVCIAPFTAWRNKKIGVSPLKLYEYLSCGKPVIASSLLGTEIVSNLDAGILVEPDNIEELKNAFKKAIEMLPYWEKRAQFLHKEIAENHSWDCRVNEIVQIMHNFKTPSPNLPE